MFTISIIRKGNHSSLTLEGCLQISFTHRGTDCQFPNYLKELSSHEIGLISKITIKFINQNLEKTIDVSKVGSYNINTNHSSTINNQNNLEKSLANQLSEEITRRLIILINDL